MVALERAGIPIEQYVAYEIDKYAIQISEKNYPSIQHCGDVTQADFKKYEGFDLLLGGSPCQGFSFAGKQLNFNDPRSKLFFEFVRAKEESQVKYFLFENVNMKQAYKDIITKYLGVEPIRINSNLVSAQNRDRFYWTNIPGVTQPKDQGILLKNIVFNRFELSTLKDLVHTPQALAYMNRQVRDGRNHWDFDHYSDIKNDKSSAVVANFFKGIPYNVFKDQDCIRKFHPIECERLQTLPDDYTRGVSNTQRYKMIGNGWTVDVIAHILHNTEWGEKTWKTTNIQNILCKSLGSAEDLSQEIPRKIAI